MTNIKIMIVNIIVSAFMVLAGIYIYDTHIAIKVYALDLKKFAKDQQRLMIRGNLDQEDLRSNFMDLQKKLNSLGENAMVITSDVVLKGVKIETE